MVLNAILDPIFRPLLNLDPFLAIFIISFLLTLGITLVYKFATDQTKMKKLKGDIKKYQEKLKKLKDNPEKMMKVQKEAMAKQMEMMKHSMKPTLFTFIPIIIIFGWLNAHMAYYQILPGEEFTIQGELSVQVDNLSIMTVPEMELLDTEVEDGLYTWALKAGDAGDYKVIIDGGSLGKVEKDFIISLDRDYAPPEQLYKKGPVSKIIIGNEEVKPLRDIALFGWRPGWLGTYIILSIILSMLLRKAMRVV